MHENIQFIDYFHSIDSGHKDFVRSMVQVGHTLITGSEDKTIKVFNIAGTS